MLLYSNEGGSFLISYLHGSSLERAGLGDTDILSAAYSAVHSPLVQLLFLALLSAAYSAVHCLGLGRGTDVALSAAYSAVHLLGGSR